MNGNNNIFNKKDVENKLKNFREGKDYSVFREGEKEIFNFHNNFLRDVFGNDYTTIYEVAESWDGDNFNYARGAAEYENDKSHITYRYEHKINKDKSGYREWSWGKEFKNRSETLSITARPRHDFNFPRDLFDNNILAPVDEAENHRRNLEAFKAERDSLEKDVENLQKYSDYETKQKIVKFQIRIGEINRKIGYHQDWLAKNDNVSHQPDWVSCQCGSSFDKKGEHFIVREVNGVGHYCSHECGQKYKTTNEKVLKYPYYSEKVYGVGKLNGCCNGSFNGCCNCGFKDIHPSDKHCMECGAELCDKAKAGKSDLEKENRELKNQLAEVQKQLTEVLEELKKLRNSSAGQNNKELDQQIDYNEKLIRNVKEVPEVEIKEQVQKSQALMNELNSITSPAKDNKGNGSLPYVIGGSVLVVSAAIIGYFLVKKSKRK